MAGGAWFVLAYPYRNYVLVVRGQYLSPGRPLSDPAAPPIVEQPPIFVHAGVELTVPVMGLFPPEHPRHARRRRHGHSLVQEGPAGTTHVSGVSDQQDASPVAGDEHPADVHGAFVRVR